jgi:hypothetical protein
MIIVDDLTIVGQYIKNYPGSLYGGSNNLKFINPDPNVMAGYWHSG